MFKKYYYTYFDKQQEKIKNILAPIEIKQNKDLKQYNTIFVKQRIMAILISFFFASLFLIGEFVELNNYTFKTALCTYILFSLFIYSTIGGFIFILFDNLLTDKKHINYIIEKKKEKKEKFLEKQLNN